MTKKYESTKCWSCLRVVLSSTVAWIVFFAIEGFEKAKITSLLGAVATNSVTIMSIMIAALAILISISGSKLIKEMSKTGHMKVLIDSLSFTALAFFVSAIVAGVGLFSTGVTSRTILVFSSSLLFYALLLLLIAGYRLYQTLIHLHK